METPGAEIFDPLTGQWAITAMFIAASTWWIVANFVLQPITTAVTIHAVNEVVSGRRIGFSGSFRAVKPRLVTAIWANAFYLIIICALLGSTLYFIFLQSQFSQSPLVPLTIYLLGVWTMLYFAIKWLFVLQAVVLDDKGPRDSLRRSFRLTSRYWWKTGSKYVLLCSPVTIVMMPAVLGLYSLDWALAQNARVPSLVVLFPITLVCTALIVFLAPFITVATSVLYYDLRARKEGHRSDFEGSVRSMPFT
jgi:hypothetical protein